MKVNKSDLIIRNIARDLLCKKVGDNIDTIAFYVEKFNSSRGLVKNAIDELIRVGAIEVIKKGTLGTCILNLNYQNLCKIAGWELIIGAAPLPYTVRLQGMATALYTTFKSTYSKFKMSYMQGAVDRGISIVDNKYSFALMSVKSANEIVKNNTSLSVLLKFDNYTYNSGLTCLAKNEDDLNKQDLVVGVDKNSPDQYFASLRSFPETVHFKEIHYTMLLESLYLGEVDAVLFNTDVVEQPEIKQELQKRQIYAKKITLNNDLLEETAACIVINKNDYGIENYLSLVLDKKQLEDIQEAVINKAKFPIV